jgi:hypothetical protein
MANRTHGADRKGTHAYNSRMCEVARLMHRIHVLRQQYSELTNPYSSNFTSLSFERGLVMGRIEEVQHSLACFGEVI